MMRVIAGEAKGRRLRTASGLGVRPTHDRVRVALFDILTPRMAGARFLDLYAGSGAVGIEALSRGAARAVFVERDGEALQALRANLETTGLAARAEVLGASVLGALERLTGRGFTVAFADPPYGETADLGPLWAALGQGELLAEGAVVVLQHHAKTPLPAEGSGLARSDQRRFGETTLTFWRRRHGASDLPGDV
jgi:16S rRNA (guanine(966)-N(2))-methyltransferase RsmD